MEHIPARRLLQSLRRVYANFVQSLGGISFIYDQKKPVENQPRLDGNSTGGNSSVDFEAKWFGSTRHIPNATLQKVAVEHLGAKHGERCTVEGVLEGSFNRAHIMRFADGSKYVIRVPAWGTEDRWQEVDGTNLRSQACTMNYIRRKTGLPVPEVFAYSTTCDNILGHPYMLIEFLEGLPICNVWSEGSDIPARETKRMAILKSLAQTMTKLSSLSFNSAGTLYFNDGDNCEPEVGPVCGTEEDPQGEQQSTPAYSDSYTMYRDALSRWWKTHPCQGGRWGGMKGVVVGHYRVLLVLLDCLPFHKSELLVQKGPSDAKDGLEAQELDSTTDIDKNQHHEEEIVGGKAAGAGKDDQDENNDNGNKEDEEDEKREEEDETEETERETFVLAPPDFDWQNILVDENNNITGVLDWDKVCTVPRYRGWAASPLWLSPEYQNQNYAWDGDSDDTVEDYQRYRRAYANFMSDAMNGQGDCMFTDKSHLFESLASALGTECCTTFDLTQILSPLLPRTCICSYLNRIGADGWYDGEKVWLRQKLGELLECRPGVDTRFSF